MTILSFISHQNMELVHTFRCLWSSLHPSAGSVVPAVWLLPPGIIHLLVH